MDRDSAHLSCGDTDCVCLNLHLQPQWKHAVNNSSSYSTPNVQCNGGPSLPEDESVSPREHLHPQLSHSGWSVPVSNFWDDN